MTEWIARYWFSLAGALVAIALGAAWLTKRENRASNPELWQAPSLTLSALFGLLLVALYVAGTHRTGRAELAYRASFFTLTSLLFFAANRYAERIALFALICRLSTSSVRPTRVLWTRIFGLLFLSGGVAAFVQLMWGD
jgi:hypothetical protein